MKTGNLLTIAALALAASAISTPIQAAYIATYDGNDCAGVFGSSFSQCAIPAGIDPKQSPVIAKYDFKNNSWEINTALFPTVTSNDFSFTYTANNGSTGSWVYSPDANDPIITYFVAKGGNFFNLFSNDGASNTDSWWTLTNIMNNKPYGLSHITFYDGGSTTPTPVPEPATMALLGAGLAGLGWSRRRKGYKA